MSLDGDAALALQVHGVQHLRLHLALGQRAGDLQQAVRQRGLAMIDVSDDAEISDSRGIHRLSVERWLRRGMMKRSRVSSIITRCPRIPHS